MGGGWCRAPLCCPSCPLVVAGGGTCSTEAHPEPDAGSAFEKDIDSLVGHCLQDEENLPGDRAQRRVPTPTPPRSCTSATLFATCSCIA